MLFFYWIHQVNVLKITLVETLISIFLVALISFLMQLNWMLKKVYVITQFFITHNYMCIWMMAQILLCPKIYWHFSLGTRVLVVHFSRFLKQYFLDENFSIYIKTRTKEICFILHLKLLKIPRLLEWNSTWWVS
jgi:hypothetical protein